MKNSLIKGLMVFLTMLGTTLAYSQDVSGTVSDASGPLPGASVLVKGTTKGAQTDAAGKFTIKDAGANAVLTISYIGLKTQEVNVAGRSTVKVTLQDGATELGQVVVIGYGSVKKKDATGAVDQLNSKKFDNVAATSPAEILRGKVAGVQVTNSSGEPGAATSIRVRGNGSIRSGNGPLIVVDGVPLAGGDVSAGGADMNLGSSTAKNPLSFVNQNDIESISILKDASSTAIYGARGANGVIVITTKKGKSKTPELTYSNSFSTSSYASKFDVLSTSEFLATAEGKKTANNYGGSYDWKKEILRSAFSMNHDLAFSSVTDKSNTRVSIGASNTEGIVRNTGLDKYTASLYNSNDFFDGKLKIETRIGYSNLRDQRGLITNNTGYIGNLLSAALYWNPTRSVYDATKPSGYTHTKVAGDGTLNPEDYLNPVHLLNSYKNNGNLSKLLGSISATAKLTKDLKYSFVLGIETSNSIVKQQAGTDLNIQDFARATNPEQQKEYRGQATVALDNRFNKTIEHNLTYVKDLTEKLNLNAIVGYSYYRYESDGTFSSAKGFPDTQTNLLENMLGGIPSEFRVSSYRGLEEIQSVFARTQFNYNNRLNLDLTVRRDGSSKAAPGKKYGTFPSLGLGYKIVQDKEGFVNDLKIRANIGRTGNTEFPRNSSTGVITYNTPGYYDTKNNEGPNITWETSDSYGLGTDFTLLKNKLTGSVDYFYKATKDLIVGIPSTSGQPSPLGIKYVNLPGELINRGFELGLNYNLIENENLKWDVSTNGSLLNNKVQGLGEANKYNVGAIHGEGLSDAYIQKIEDGYPLYNYYMAEFTGYDSSGKSTYADGGKDKMLDKQPLPKLNVGFSTSVAYKSFDASASFYGAFGHYIYNNTANVLFNKSQLGGKNVTSAVANSEQSPSDSNKQSTKYLEKGDFMRLGNLTVGYTVSGDILDRFKVKSARFYLNGSNLLLFTNYSGFDPEVDTDKSRNGIPSAGIDYLSYPRARTFSLGLNVTF
jgi:TonB-dependent starch-binding outer membrane protein SusC